MGNTNSASGDILEAFGRFGKSVNVRVDDFPMFERYLLNLHYKKVPPGILTLAELRWPVFSKNQADSEKLPPTLATLGEKVNRAHYISLPWKTSHVSNLSLLDPIGYRWYCNTNERIFEPVMTKLAPSP